MKGFIEVTEEGTGLRYTLPVLYMTVCEKTGSCVYVYPNPEWVIKVQESYEHVRELIAEALHSTPKQEGK